MLPTAFSREAFTFITRCMNDLFFYDDCPGPKVTIVDSSPGLPVKGFRRDRQSRSEAGIEAARSLGEFLREEENPHTLQLCSWHAAEAIKKWVITEGYPLEVRKQLVILIWSWINSPTMSALQERHAALLAKLRPKGRDHLLSYYQRQERQFAHAYTKHFLELNLLKWRRVPMAQLSWPQIGIRLLVTLSSYAY